MAIPCLDDLLNVLRLIFLEKKRWAPFRVLTYIWLLFVQLAHAYIR